MDLLINIFLSYLDLFNIFNLYHGIANKKPVFNIKLILVSIIWGTLNAVYLYYVNISTMKFIIYFCVFGYIWFLCRERFYETFIIFILIWVLIFIIQFIVGIFLQILQINFIPMMIIGQLTTTLFTILVSKLPINKIYKIFQKDLPIKLLFYFLSVVVFILCHREAILVNFIPYAPFGIIILSGIFHTIKSISYYEVTKYSSVYHDMKNMFFGIYCATQCSYDLETLKDKLQGYYDVLGFDIKAQKINTENSTEMIHSLIDLKLKETDKNLSIHKDIAYYSDNVNIPISSITYMIGVLLDYIISVSNLEDEIKIYLRCAEYNLNIKCSYRYSEVRSNIFKLINKKRLLSDKKLGHGLSNLKKMIINYKGEFNAQKEFYDIVLVVSIFN